MRTVNYLFLLLAQALLFVEAFAPLPMLGRRAILYPSAFPTRLDSTLKPKNENVTSTGGQPDMDNLQEQASDLKMLNAASETTTSTPHSEWLVMDGAAKREEPGDGDKISHAIRAFQRSIWKEEQPHFPIDKILSRILDTMEDLYVHARRWPYDYFGWVQEPDTTATHRHTVVVLGSGWAAHAFLKVADPYKLRIIVVSPSNHFVFTPMLASAAVGTVEYRSMTEAVRAANPMIDNYLEGAATDIDLEKHTISVQMQSLLEDIREGEPPKLEISYDTLICAVGCKAADDLVPGAKENSLRLKSCDDARRLRNAIGEAFEFASRPSVKDDKQLGDRERAGRREERRKRLTFCLVGGGPTGVELAGELCDFMKDITKPRVGAYPLLKDDVRIVLIQGGGDLVPQFDKPLRKHALESLQKCGVEVRLNTKVKEVGDGYVILSSGGTEELLPTGLNVWAAGTTMVPFTAKLLEKLPDAARARSGKVNVDKWLRCPMPENAAFGSVMVMGDAAAFIDGENSCLPQTAQVAGQQGAYAARLLDRSYDMAKTPPVIGPDNNAMNTWLRLRGLERAGGFNFLNLGLLAYVGSGEALTQVQIGDVPVFSYAGSISFMLWRSVYLVKQVATRNRVLVTFDWIKSALFGRDITRL